MSQNKKFLEKISDLKNWAASSQQHIDYAQSYYIKSIGDFSVTSSPKISLALDRFFTYYGTVGVSNLNNLESEASKHIQRAIQYKYWSLKFDYAFFEKRKFLNPVIEQKDLSTNYTDTANVLAAMIAINNSTMAWDAAEMLKNMLFNEGYVYKLHLENSSFEPFMYWLSQKQLGNALPNLSQFKLGVYQDMIDCWDSDNFYPTLEKLIYYHIDNMDDNDKFGQDQFRKSPFDLMFFEIFAILKVANKPIPDFSVIDPFFSKLNNMTSIELQPDEVISKIETLFYETF